MRNGLTGVLARLDLALADRGGRRRTVAAWRCDPLTLF